MSEPPQKYRVVPYVSPRGRKPVEEFLNELEVKDPDGSVVFYDVILPELEKHGGALGMPHFKYLPPTDFSEIRWDGLDRGHYRIYCTVESGGKILLLHGITKRWPDFKRRDKRICEQRYRDYCSTDYDAAKRLADRE